MRKPRKILDVEVNFKLKKILIYLLLDSFYFLPLHIYTSYIAFDMFILNPSKVVLEDITTSCQT